MRKAFWLAAFLSLGSCDALWGSYDTGNERNCTKNLSLCGAGYLCDGIGDMATKVCVKECTSYADCPAGSNDICHNGLCLGCGALSPADVPKECSQRSIVGQNPLKACFQNTCVQCADFTQCGDDSACIDHACVDSCTKHEDCQSKVCDVYQTNSKGGLGKCLSTKAVIYVDNKNGACTKMDAGSGIMGDPYCDITYALAHLKGNTAVRVMPSTKNYGSLSIMSSTLSLYGGFGSGQDSSLGGDSGTLGVNIGGRANATLDGFVVDGSAGVSCNMATMALRRTRVQGSAGVGVALNNCTGAKIDRVLVTKGLHVAAIGISGDSTSYNMTNSFITNNTTIGSPLVSIAGNNSGKFQYNTVAGNNSDNVIFDCGGVIRNIEDSIITGNQFAGMSQFFSAACVLKNTVIGSKDLAKGGLSLDPSFVSPGAPMFDYHLMDDATSAACCIDKGTVNSDIKTDYDGTSRPQGAGYDIGAHELPRMN